MVRGVVVVAVGSLGSQGHWRREMGIVLRIMGLHGDGTKADLTKDARS